MMIENRHHKKCVQTSLLSEARSLVTSERKDPRVHRGAALAASCRLLAASVTRALLFAMSVTLLTEQRKG